jgi:hypothetical protein
MASHLDRNINDRILELQNEGANYKIYRPIFDSLISENHPTPRGNSAPNDTMVDHIICVLRSGIDTSFVPTSDSRQLRKCVGSMFPFEAQMKVIGGLLAEYYHEWKIYNTHNANVNKCAEIPEPPRHLDRAIAEQKAYYNPNKSKDTSMTIKIESKTFFNGVDLATYTDDQLFGKISEAEKEVERLEAIVAKPKKLVKKIQELKDGIDALAAAIDAR